MSSDRAAAAGNSNDGDTGITNRPPSAEAAENQPLPPLSVSWVHDPLSQTQEDKVDSIRQACIARDLDSLREFATSKGGLVTDEVRRTAWPILLGCHHDQQPAPYANEWTSLPQHRDEDQVQLDVNRSFVYYPKSMCCSPILTPHEIRDERKHELLALISSTLRRHPHLHYFQGYHDIIQVLLLVLGLDAAVPAAARISLLHIRDFMLPTMAGTEPHLRLFKHVTYAVDPALAQHLQKVEPFFALAATLTLYAHEIEEYGDIARLFDFLLANEAVMPLYLYAAIVISRKKELFEFGADEPEMLHAILSKMPKPLDLDSLILRASEMFVHYPPEKLPGRAWSRISSNSVLKTTHADPQQLVQQTLEDGERMFQRQAAEIRRHEARQRQIMHARLLFRRYKRPATYTAAAVLVAVTALLIGRGGSQQVNDIGLFVFTGIRERLTTTLKLLH
ncbi:hypothetical protein KC360_g7193 [Hortaea werneckii]|nr:hypothetical protein KC325_g7191 [Hortaea werneckii]KAI6988706.1 hypothetical protein KC359_g7604 [Hortaea werneckii]KAI7142476.1 hypothetical protein KC344_g7162 [Hortaea werneckii]KAI7169907.1 hypothetical protein KC360_g7193 [Hortaea werneckii]KAI7506528.1 hypothetical protein KC347_g7566 [Hortaea werneckii]